MLPIDRVRTALFVPASKRRAIEKARSLPCDLVILDLEDSVPATSKDEARQAAEIAIADDRTSLVACRVNQTSSRWHADDVAMLAKVRADFAVLPKAEDAATIAALADRTGVPVLAMIETPAAIYAAREIAAAPGAAGLVVGPNDLASALRLPTFADRNAMLLACQSVVLAARSGGIAAFDGVFNRLDDPAGFAADCVAGRALGFDGKTVIHPSQIDTANRVFGPSIEEVEDAEALIAAATEGAERFRGRMIEGMHVDAARRILARARVN